MILRGNVWYFVAMIKGKRFKEALSSDVREAMALRDDYCYQARKYGRLVAKTVDHNPQDTLEGMLLVRLPRFGQR